MKNIFDFIVVGSGPAGSTISELLYENNFKIAIVDRASDKQKGKKKFIFNPYVNKCPNYYTPSFSDQLGGNSALWHKKIYLISRDEFFNGKWPIKYSEILKYSKILAKKLKVNHPDLIYKNKNDQKIKYSQSIRADFSNLYDFYNLKEKKNISIFKNSSPVRLIFKNRKKISGVQVYNYETKENNLLYVSKAVIFCAGGLGNTFLIKNLIKSLNNQSGKFLCDHPHLQILKINGKSAKNFKEISKVFIFSKNKKKNQKKKELNIYLKKKNYFAGIQLTTNTDPNLLLSRIYLKSNLFTLLGSPFGFAKKIINFIMFILTILFKIYYSILDIFNLPGKYSFEFFFSQRKNFKNNIKLNDTKLDKFGLKKIDINWSINTKESKNYEKIINSFLKLNKKKINFKNYSLEDINKKIYVGLHPSCLNPFGNKKKNIIDKNLKIKKISNLFVCGSDVFPSNGFTNPTWTIMTLGTRLTHYLLKKFN